MPGEIRNAIYRILLIKTYAWQQKTRACSPLYPAILRANRQIYEEAVNILHGENIWIIAEINACYWPRFAAIMPKVSRKDPGNIKHPALHIKFATLIPSEAPQQHVTFIMGGAILWYFILVLWRLSKDSRTKDAFGASSLELTLCETPFHTTSGLQSICLRPFGLVYGLRSLVIHGKVEPACVEELLHRAASPSKDAAQIQDVLRGYLDKGDKAYLAGEWRSALAYYVRASKLLWHMAFRPEEAAYQDFTLADNYIFTKALLVIASRTARASMALGDYKGVKKLGGSVLKDRSLADVVSIFEDASTTQDDGLRPMFLLKQAQVHLGLYVARAHRALGEKEDESRLLEEAFNAENDKSTLLTALGELFPNAAPEQTEFLVEQQAKLQRGEAISLDAIRAFWEAV